MRGEPHATETSQGGGSHSQEITKHSPQSLNETLLKEKNREMEVKEQFVPQFRSGKEGDLQEEQSEPKLGFAPGDGDGNKFVSVPHEQDTGDSGGVDNAFLSLPHLEDMSDAAYVHSSFDPVNLFEVGLREWRNRTLSLQCLHRSRTVPVGQALRGRPSGGDKALAPCPVGNISKRYGSIPDYFEVTKRWQEAYENQQKLKLRFSRNKETQQQDQLNQDNQQPQLLEEYYSALSNAPHASLIHLVIVYHQELLKHGLVDEAIRISALLEGLREAEPENIETDLRGMDLLLKDGLLDFYLCIQPHLPPVPSQIVRFKNLTYSMDINFLDNSYDTVLTKAVKCIEGPLQKKKGPQTVSVLKDVTGYLMPGTMTLVLGPPLCGKSSLHNVLSGHFDAGGSYEGIITYNDEELPLTKIHRLAAVVGRLDVHLSLLTIRETIKFARECIYAYKSMHYGPELLEIMGEALNVGQDPKVEVVLSMMGLKHVASRFVGSPIMPSIPEDERHRVTAAEMFCGAHSVYFFDHLSSIAEDSITYDLLTSVRIFTRVRQIAVMASLLQPSSEIFDLFDRLIVLNQGHIVYQGPREDALSYFEGLGYKKPEHLSVGEFLQEVTTNDGVAYLQPGFDKLQLEDFISFYRKSNMYKDICRVVDSPSLVQELWVQGNHPLGVTFFKNSKKEVHEVQEPLSYVVSDMFTKNGGLVDVSMDHTTNIQAGDKVVAISGSDGTLQYVDLSTKGRESFENCLANSTKPVRMQLERPFKKVDNKLTTEFFCRDYVLDKKSQFLLLVKRELKISWRNKFSLAIRLLQVIAMSTFVSFLLFRVHNNADQRNMNLYRTCFFISILNMTTVNTIQLPALFDERMVYYKQKGAHFFRPGSYLLAKAISGIPFSLCEATIWTLIVYFVTGMSVADGGWHFFVYYLIMILTVLHGASMIRFIGFFASQKEKAGLILGLLVTLFVLFAGFLMPHFQVPKYWIWMYYMDPLQWAITALMVNEYNSSNYSMLCKDVPDLTKIPQCVGRPNNTVGHAYLAKGQFYTSHHWIAVAVGVMCAWILLWNILAYISILKTTHTQVFRISRPVKAKNKISTELEMEDVENAKQFLSHTALPITLSWHELSYDLMVPSMKTTRTILNYVSGWGEPCDIVALIGSNGSGKTTLLNCLAGRKVLKEYIGGQILVNGYPKVQKTFGHIMGYVDKIDAYAPYTTVRETIAFSAATRIAGISSRKRQKEFVEEILELTELKHLENSLVVSLINDVTFDQEKRLAIATELAANPSILFLDDPIKGLDSLSAARITRCLQQVASTGRLVISTLKYPSQRILSKFTKLQILKTGGETVYFGPVGVNGELIKNYFQTIPGTPLCPPNKSISAYAIDLIADNVTYRKAIKDYAFEYRISELALRNHVHLQHLRRARGQIGPNIDSDGYHAGFLSKLHENILALQRQYWRNVNYSWGRMLSFLIMSILLGSVYFKIDDDTNAAMNSRAGAIFISLVLVGLTNAQNTIPMVMQLRAISKRERSVHQSNPIIYNISFTLAEVPYLLAANLIFCSIFLPMARMAVDSARNFFAYWFISGLFYVIATFLGIFLGVISPTAQIASVLVPVIIGMWTPTSGLVIPKSKILPEYIWVFWINPLQYALNSLTSLAFYCDVNKPACMDNRLNPQCMQEQAACPRCDCPRLSDANNVFVWTQISSTRSLNAHRLGYDIMALLMFAALTRCLTFLAMKFLQHNKRT